MSLIPLMLGRASAHLSPEPAGPARYNPGGGHRPVAGLVAVGLPVALVIAVALSPFELPVPKEFDPIITEHIPMPVPPPEPVTERQQQPESTPTTVPKPFPMPPVPDVPIFEPPTDKPVPTGPIVGEGPGTGTETPPPLPLPPLIEAKLDPRYQSTFQPDYPPYELRREIEGKARVRVLVGIDGRVKTVEDVATTSPGFFAETRRRALAKWRFKPATRGGTPEESWVTMTVRFELNS